MFRKYISFLLLASISVLAYAQAPAPEPQTAEQPAVADEIAKATAPDSDVPEIAEWEIQRRGNMVQETGTIRASDVDIIADALAVPEDDSHKWFINVVTTDGCKYCDKLKYDIINSDVFRAWINVDEPTKSTCHYQVRDINDRTQADWFAGIKSHLSKGGFPAVVIQPPKNGEYGPNKTVVAIFHGYAGDPEKTTFEWRNAIIRYVQTLQQRKQIGHTGNNATRSGIARAGGMQQSGDVIGQTGDVGAPPPFSVPNTNNPFQPSPDSNNNWPPAPQPQCFTIEQIKLMIPTAPPEFIMQCLQAKVCDTNTLMQHWQLWQQAHPNASTVAPLVNPITPPSTNTVMQLLLLMLGGGNMLGLVAGGWLIYRKLQKSRGGQLLITDEQFNYLYNLLLNGGQPPPQNAQSIGAAPVAIIPRPQ